MAKKRNEAELKIIIKNKLSPLIKCAIRRRPFLLHGCEVFAPLCMENKFLWCVSFNVGWNTREFVCTERERKMLSHQILLLRRAASLARANTLVRLTCPNNNQTASAQEENVMWDALEWEKDHDRLAAFHFNWEPHICSGIFNIMLPQSDSKYSGTWEVRCGNLRGSENCLLCAVFY